MTDDRTAEENGIKATYDVTETERVLAFETGFQLEERGERGDDAKTDVRGGDAEAAERGASRTSRAHTTAAIAQNREGYAMLKVRPTADGDELERYYGFDMALDHAAELLGVSPHELPVPPAAEDMGM
ncbi:DUF7111 family protein [Natrarchaeobius chitinivorans]|uniref:Uncharacterized protein n=1 Tax=Natrarchaeobius chitinivorans TaxID=1679083 RepID=A0A3N6MJK0_NATCH|nr:hypothetical protein [Natrarchaeobius chitinivorans]RQG97300.1 hypothetical protein EA473_04340 [Natrarchaeobius chitinivorans]